MLDALSMTTGDIVFLADQDDIWHPDKAEGMVRIFLKHPKVSCLLGNFNIIDSQGKRMTHSQKGDNPFSLGHVQKTDSNLYHVDLATIMAHNVSPGATQAIARKVVDIFPHVKNMPGCTIGV